MSQYPAAKLRSNVLHQYVNYTYTLQMWALTPNDFNKIAGGQITPNNPDSIFGPNSKLLISSSGVGSDQSSFRSQFFPTDFGIDDLEITTINGNSGPQARGTDNITINFNIIEPYSVTLIDRLIKLAGTPVGMGKDFKTIIYCMKIMFFGYDDTGKPQLIKDANKYMPFSIINMEFSITNKGAVYKCQAIPPQNYSLSDVDNIVPFHVELKGRTIKDVFSADTVSSSTTNTNTARSQSSNVIPNNSDITVTTGVARALNDNEKFKVKLGSQTYANVYKFEFQDGLGDASIVDPNKLPDNAITMAPVKGQAGSTAQIQARDGTITIEKTGSTFRTQAGSRITDLIKTVMMVTDFMKNQVVLRGKAPDLTKPYTGIKIIPRMKINETNGYDPKTNFYVREVTYVVKKFEHYGEAHGEINQKAMPTEMAVKDYEYIFTGHNKDIIKVNLEFRMAFLQYRSGTKPTTSELAGDSSGEITGDTKNATVEQQKVVEDDYFKIGTLQTNQNVQNFNSADVSKDNRAMTLAEMTTKLYDIYGGDMLSLDIEIVGDPDWIQQDNVFYGTAVDSQQKTLSNGSINFQTSTTGFNFTFKSPTTDYDDTKGLFNLGSASTATFSGTYRVLTIASRFSRGRFTQKLDNVRMQLQKDPTIAARSDTTSSNTTSSNTTPTTPANNTAISQNSLNPTTGNYIGIGGETALPTFQSGA